MFVDDPDTVRSILRLVELLPGVDLPLELDGLVERLESPAPGVALVGLFNRGKSTLFNALVGAAVSPVSLTPETSTYVVARTGMPRALGVVDGAHRELPSEPDAFAEQISRASGQRWDLVEIQGDFRLPEDARLIDMPGMNEAGAGFGSDWLRMGVHAAVVVVSWPPGLSSQEVDLVRRARAVLNDAVAVVVTSTASLGVSEDLGSVARKIHDETGISPVVAPPGTPVGRWREDESWAELELTIDELWNAAEASQRILLRRLAVWVDDLEAWARSTPWVDGHLEYLDRAVTVSAYDGPLRTAVDHARRVIRQRIQAAERADREERERAARQRRQREERERRERQLDGKAIPLVDDAQLKLAEARAWQPQGILDALVGNDGMYRSAGAAYRRVIELARQGSPTASAACSGLLRDALADGELLPKIGLRKVDLISVATDPAILRNALTQSNMAVSDLLHLRRENMGRNSPLVEQIDAILIAHLARCDVRRLLMKSPLHRARVAAAERSAAQLCTAWHRRLWEPVSSRRSTEQKLAALVEKSEKLLEKAAARDSTGRYLRQLREYLSYYAVHGSAWLDDRAAVVDRAKNAVARRREQLKRNSVGLLVAIALTCALATWDSLRQPMATLAIVEAAILFAMMVKIDALKEPNAWREYLPFVSDELTTDKAPPKLGRS